jgi:hypothetical protein
MAFWFHRLLDVPPAQLHPRSLLGLERAGWRAALTRKGSRMVTLKEKPKSRLDPHALLCPKCKTPMKYASAFLSLATSSLTWITAATNAEQRFCEPCHAGADPDACTGEPSFDHLVGERHAAAIIRAGLLDCASPDLRGNGGRFKVPACLG